MAKLAEEEIRRRLRRLRGWRYVRGELRRALRFEDYLSEVAFFNLLALQAERMDHHPDVRLSWGRMELSLTTHSEGGVTEKDFLLAEGIEKAYRLLRARSRRAS
ncbi:MAG: 4a-hydroxytetrahydrobiopterin dehydratase [Nitrososphaerota archaeon]